MMGNQHQSLGIKQVIKLQWLEYTVGLVMDGLSPNDIRIKLHGYIEQEMSKGFEGGRSQHSIGFVVNIMMRVWVSPEPEFIELRDASCYLLQNNPDSGFITHWGMISVAYPFWFNVASQVGRLLTLQTKVSQKQIIARLIEQYGDRQTVSRYARYVIRSLVAWGVIKDSPDKGCYVKAAPLVIKDVTTVSTLYESAIVVSQKKQMPLGLLVSCPAWFPFKLPHVTGHHLTTHNSRLEVIRYGLDDEMVRIKDGGR